MRERFRDAAGMTLKSERNKVRPVEAYRELGPRVQTPQTEQIVGNWNATKR